MKRLARRTVLIAAVLVVLAIMASAAVYGYFTSSRTIANNEVSTGTIQLTVNDDGIAAPVTLTHIMPGDTGTVGNYLIKNIGDTHGTLYVGVHGNDPLGDGSNFNDPLAQALQVAYWLDVTNDGLWNAGDCYFYPDGRYRNFQTGDDLSVPAAAYFSLFDWNNKFSNTLDVPGLSTAGTLKMTYSLPMSIDDPALMGKRCNYDLIVELHQFHAETHTITLGSASGHNDVTWAAFRDGVLVDRGNVGGNGYVITLPANLYTIVFTDAGTGKTLTKPNIDISLHNMDAATFGDLPVNF